MSEPRRTDPRRTIGVFVREGNEPPEGVKIRASEGGMLRSSNAIARIRKDNPAGARMLELLREQIGRECPVHGHLDDPIIGLVGDEVAFGCPDCSGEEIRRQWAEEPIEQ